jgi:virginiamycin A acetyltransferase
LNWESLICRVKGKIRSLLSPPQVPSWTAMTPTMLVRFEGNARPQFSTGPLSYSQGLTIHCWDPTVRIEIGNYCSIATDVMIIAGGEHDTDYVTTYPLIDRWGLSQHLGLIKSRFKGHIVIGNDVWIGARSTILSGITIGNGAVIGAGTLVAKDVPPYGIVVGNPARLLRHRFDPETIARLEETRWWEFDMETMTEFAGSISNPNAFINAIATWRAQSI